MCDGGISYHDVGSRGDHEFASCMGPTRLTSSASDHRNHQQPVRASQPHTSPIRWLAATSSRPRHRCCTLYTCYSPEITTTERDLRLYFVLVTDSSRASCRHNRRCGLQLASSTEECFYFCQHPAAANLANRPIISVYTHL